MKPKLEAMDPYRRRELVDRWKRVLTQWNETQRETLAILLSNQETYSSSVDKDVDTYQQYAMPLIRKQLPRLLYDG